MILNRQLKVVGYCRLSRDDGRDGESSSIESQKQIIERYCIDNNLIVKDFYVDDGVSGTTFNRPSFLKMIEEVEKGSVNCIITKDLSRLGRDYIMTGYYTEVFFPDNSIRYIAINDNFDSEQSRNSSNDLAPIKHVFNDMYAKDISKKIRVSMYTKALNGEHFTTYAPMGYKKSAIEKNKIEIDEEIAPIIRAIFSMYLRGKGCQEIRNILISKKVRTPSAWAHYKGYINNSRYGFDEDEQKQYRWSNDMVTRILKNETYIGSTVHYRTRKATHKSKSRKQAKDDLLIIKNTHERIIEVGTFEQVQKTLGLHRKPQNKRKNIFIGIAKCSDCGWSMKLGQSTHVRKRDGVEITRKYLSCLNNNKYGRKVCTCHYTDYYELEELTLQTINEVINSIKLNEEEMVDSIMKKTNSESQKIKESLKLQLNKMNKRLREIESIFIKLYEDRALGKINEDTYELLSEKYVKEKSDINEQIITIENKLSTSDQEEDNTQKFVDLVKDMKQIETLDEEILNTLIDKIVIHNAVGKGATKKQKIDIYFKFIGDISE